MNNKNGLAISLGEGEAARAMAGYPHARVTNDLIYVSGVSSRTPDNLFVGAKLKDDGSWELDIEEQTHAVIKNIEKILKKAGAGLENLLDLTVFLVDMKHYTLFNRVYNQYFDCNNGPTRTTVAVHQLPAPQILIEIKAVARFPH